MIFKISIYDRNNNNHNNNSNNNNSSSNHSNTKKVFLITPLGKNREIDIFQKDFDQKLIVFWRRLAF